MIARLLLATALTLSLTACSTDPVNETHNGDLATGDSTHPRDGSFYDMYTFEAKEGWQIKVRMNSPAFDTYLQLRRQGVDDSAFLQENDDINGTDKNSEIAITAPASGTYVVWANSYDSGATGAYTLQIQANPAQ